jgi:protein-tyrosine-phosphatase
MAEGLLRHRLEARGVDAHVHSAGFVTRGQPASAYGVDTMRDGYRIDLRAHRSRLVDVDMVSRADLILGLARRHVFEVARERPDAFGRTFTLKELVRRADAVGMRAHDEPLEHWLARLHEGRMPNDLWGESPDDDVDDPIGESAEVYRHIAAEIDALVGRLVDAVWGGESARRTTRRETA